MERTQTTKESIAQTYKELVRSKRASNIPVHEIAAGSGVNRKTFYYHFPD